MIATIDSLFSDALSLPDDSRLQLVERLVSSIQSEPALDTEQVLEVRRRIEEVRAGQVKTIPGEEVFLEVRQSLAARRMA
jgi:putative addiction module component (TIGR02574 family)